MNKTLIAALIAAGTVPALGQNLTRNAAFLDVDMDGNVGDEWGFFGAALALDFFGDGNPGHATLFADNVANEGGFFQVGIPATPGNDYTMTIRIQWEANWEADTFYAIEFYADDDETKLGEELVEITDELVDSGYQRFDVTGTAPAGTAFVRPLVRFENVQSAGASRAATVDNVIIRENDPTRSLNPGFGDLVEDGNNGDFWNSFGAVALDLDFFNNGNPGHATFFADLPGNEGFLFQQGIAAEPNTSYTFSIDLAFEDNWDADTFIGLEYFGADDAFNLGLDEVQITPAPGAGYQTFTIEATTPTSPFLTFVRPIVRFGGGTGAAAELEAATADNGVLLLTSDVADPRLCADQNDDDLVNGLDFGAWLGNFNAGSLIADVNQDGLVNGLDFGAWLGAFNMGAMGPTCTP